MNNNSNGVNRSDGVNKSVGVNKSDGVNLSFGVNSSDGVNRSYGVNRSFGVNRSNGVNNSGGVNKSNGVNNSFGVNWSYGVNKSNGVNRSFGVFNSFGVSNEIFVCNKERTYNIFGQNVNKSRWDSVYNTLHKHLNGWFPKFNNAFELYIKANSDWKKVKANYIKGTLNDYEEPYEAWKDMPKAAIDYIKSLPEFDAVIFETVTGIKSDTIADNKKKELLNKADELIKNAEELKKQANLL